VCTNVDIKIKCKDALEEIYSIDPDFFIDIDHGVSYNLGNNC
jgi:hypothetical protein